MNSYTSPSTKPLYRGTQVVWYVLSIIEVLLVFRFALKLFGANAGALFTGFIYGVTNIFVMPFMRVFRVSEGIGSSLFEWTTLLAMFVYWVLAVGIIKLFLISKTVSTPEAASKLKEQEK